MNDQSPGRGRRALDRLRGGGSADLVALKERLDDLEVKVAETRRLRRRVAELEADLQEARRLNRRVAELLDIVEELLVPLSLRDEERVKAFLDSHTVPL